MIVYVWSPHERRIFAVSVTVKREFMEEALDSTGSGKENTEQMKEMIGEFFEQGTEVYKGEGNSVVVPS